MDNDSVKKNIEGIRRELGLSQQAMAEKLGITRNAYRRIEKGETRTFSEVIQKIADLSGHSVEEVFIGFHPYASYNAALEDEHTRNTAKFEIMKSDYETRIQSLTSENGHLMKLLERAESEISTLKSMVAMLEKNINQQKND